jgi:hypothetical protein
MSEQMRKEFEEWIDSLSFEDLNSIDENSAWKAWQASRAALVVELPDWFVFGIDAACYRDDVIEALNKEGVSYK